jgi:hypothetical protein
MSTCSIAIHRFLKFGPNHPKEVACKVIDILGDNEWEKVYMS